ncbi:tannase/feruloyl esterase family alpha/beta hydrolase [Bradyrhizobium sp. KB893862 SZCCT0404]|uniref:tannase/feruloyl esterase family alpha/beta hydrolase n=1 Tax=Bradyrhizobium sp. KB893862 SZCCT0404 TaxID=2807672 RepID=UPI001BA51A57|nr:tannase/feruloyl esterase family alpha/beta hydrolase [Bradyrhizobium sp. KB893862 SZCCT0404]MBR1175250.1 tannase/feruloyl esterase family alpha/beta hydrolase [Bradyrhizobium sp. KB893862 SZCCT0404]
MIISPFRTALLSSVALLPMQLTPAAAVTPMSCTSLAAYVTQQAGEALNPNPISPSSSITISSATPVTAKVIAAAQGNLSYCQVVFQIAPAITIQVGLPLNQTDGGSGIGCNDTTVANNSCKQGNWNGKIQAIGNGGFSGSVPGVTAATNTGFAASSTDNGHSKNWCNATNPVTGQANGQPDCGAQGAGFALAPNKTLNVTQIDDFMDRSLVQQTVWVQQLAQAYYGTKPTRTYWNGCSTGGRQGFQMAQFHPTYFDGILAGAPAFNWNRFQMGEAWGLTVVKDVDPTDCAAGTAASCAAGVSQTFLNASTAANNAAVAACDAADGVTDGVINEPRRCTFDATTLVGQKLSPMTTPMTTAQAMAINLIWDGPRNQRGQRLWAGPTRGTSFSTELDKLSTNKVWAYVQQWFLQDPNADFTQVTMQNFAQYFQDQEIKFADTTAPGGPKATVVAAATDVTNLHELMTGGVKLLHYRGLADPLILPFNSWNYDTRLFERYGLAQTKNFYRSFYYPGNGHCRGNDGFANSGLINSTDLFNALIHWVEDGKAPESMIANTKSNGTGNTTLVCAYPNETHYNGGPATSASSYSCVTRSAEPADLAAYDHTALQYHETP